MGAGYYKRRRGAVEHIESGTIDLLEDGIHDYLSLKANLVIGNGYRLPAGVVSISAPALHAYCKRVSERTIQRVLNHLEEIGWLKFSPWRTPGKRGNYMVVICRASVHDLSGNEYRVNGAKTVDWQHPVYELVGERLAGCRRTVGEVSGLRELENGDKPSPNVPVKDSLVEQEAKEAAFGVFWEKWPRHQAKQAARRAWMKIPISEYGPIMVGLDKWQRSEQWTRGFIPHPATWLNEKRWSDEDIPQFKGTNGASSMSLGELRQKRSAITDQGKSLLEKAGGLIQ